MCSVQNLQNKNHIFLEHFKCSVISRDITRNLKKQSSDRFKLLTRTHSTISLFSFAIFTAHQITETWQLESHVLQALVMYESHTATNMKMMFHAVVDKCNLTIADMVIVTDNAANILAAVQLENSHHLFCTHLKPGCPTSIRTQYFVTTSWEDKTNNWVFPPKPHRNVFILENM